MCQFRINDQWRVCFVWKAGHAEQVEIVDYHDQESQPCASLSRFTPGKSCIRGLRITIYDVLGWLAAGMTGKEIVDDYPELTGEGIRACLAYAAEREHRIVRLPRSA